MYRIDKKISYNEKKYWLRLNPDKTLIPQEWRPPIIWGGFVNQQKVTFTQISNSAVGLSDFDFTGFPEEFEGIQGEIVNAINRTMRTMD